MNRQHKIWGERWLLHQDSTHNVSYLKIKAGYRCSWHTHQAKANLFVVIRGKFGIHTEHGETVLTEGHCFTVPPGLEHEFKAYEDSEVIEEMFVSYDEADIVRSNIGGVFEEPKARPNISTHINKSGAQ